MAYYEIAVGDNPCPFVHEGSNFIEQDAMHLTIRNA